MTSPSWTPPSPVRPEFKEPDLQRSPANGKPKESRKIRFVDPEQLPKNPPLTGIPPQKHVKAHTLEVTTVSGMERVKARKRFGHTGRNPKWVRDICRQEFAKRIPALCNIADGAYLRRYQTVTHSGKVVSLTESPSIANRLEALKLLAKYGGLETTTIIDDDGNDATRKLANAAVAGAVAMLGGLAERLAGGSTPQDQVVIRGAAKPDHTSG